MNSEVKEILIDLIDYYNVIGTEDDPGFEPFADIVSRASKALEYDALNSRNGQNKGSGDIDPFAMNAVGTRKEKIFKHEDEF